MQSCGKQASGGAGGGPRRSGRLCKDFENVVNMSFCMICQKIYILRRLSSLSVKRAYRINDWFGGKRK